MTHATQTLPKTHSLAWRLDMKKDLRLNILLQVGATIWFFAVAWLLVQAFNTWRPGFTLSILGTQQMLLSLAVSLAAIAGAILLHELVHGLFFWWFSRARPSFGLGAGYAYAAVPGWYFAKWPYLVIGLSPLVLLTALGLLALLVVPAEWLSMLFLAIAFNAGGAAGDIFVCIRVALSPDSVLVQDLGDVFELYRETPQA